MSLNPSEANAWIDYKSALALEVTSDDLNDRNGEEGLGRLLGACAPMRDLFQRVRRVAPTGVSILLTGESGTGKELVAETIHSLSTGRDEPFVAVNCGAIPATLVEAELFGYERGSFTGAVRSQAGYFERAGRGTLFLDEAGEMPLDMQVKLLRALESRRFCRVGGDREIPLQARVIAATNRSLADALAENKFRADLLYRLAVFHLNIPPLRRRGAVLDIGCNAGFYSIEMARRGARVLGLDVEPMYLRQARWAARQFGLEEQLEFVEGDVYRLLNLRRQFDLVWFTGVYYHLRYPTLALDLVRSVTGRTMVFQSMTMPGESQRRPPPDLSMHEREQMLEDYWPKMAFVEHRVENDPSNWWVPNAMCVEALLRSSGFEVISRPEHEFYVCRPVDIPGESRRDLAQLRAAAMPLHS